MRRYTAEQALAYLQDLPSDLSDNDGQNDNNEDDDEAPTITAIESASSSCDSSDEDVPALSVRS